MQFYRPIASLIRPIKMAQLTFQKNSSALPTTVHHLLTKQIIPFAQTPVKITCIECIAYVSTIHRTIPHFTSLITFICKCRRSWVGTTQLIFVNTLVIGHKLSNVSNFGHNFRWWISCDGQSLRQSSAQFQLVFFFVNDNWIPYCQGDA